MKLKSLKLKILTFLLVLTASASASAQNYESILKSGNAAYNEGKYVEAQGLYVKAIQADPGAALGYRNLARAYFWTDQYAAAAHYYEHYLKLAPAESADLEQVRGERKLAVSRAGEDVYRMPENIRMARQALETELGSGKAFTPGGGGAWGLYETLLRTGYADPDLVQIRATLTRRLMDELDAKMLPAPQDILPIASFEDWQVQAQRLVAIKKIQKDPVVLDLVNRRSTVVESAIALLAGQPEQAVDLARLARSSNPDLKFLAWYEIVALTRANKHEEALNAVETFARQLRAENPAQLGHAMALRALILKREDRSKDAAEVLKTLIVQTP